MYRRISKEKQEELVGRVLEEIRLHKLREIETLTPTEQLAKDYDVAKQTIFYHIKSISEEDRKYRSGVCQDRGRRRMPKEKQKELVNRIKEELRLHRLGKIGTLTSTKQLAKEYNIKIITMARHIRTIPEEDRKYRNSILLSQNWKSSRILESDLSKARKSLGLTPKEAAEMIGASHSYYQQIEAMNYFPSARIQKKICDFYEKIIGDEPIEFMPLLSIERKIRYQWRLEML